MKELIKIAWRNLWRSKRRTILTMTSIILAACMAMFTRSMQKGSYENMISNAVKLSTGYFQVQANGYWENKSIDKTFIDSPTLLNKIKNRENVGIIAPRLESFALVSSGKHTKGALIIATEPEIENELNKLSEKLISGEYLNADDNQILVVEKLAEYLQVSVGDTLVLLGQGYHGVTAAAKYRVKGIIKFPIPQLNNQLIYLPLKAGQDFYSAYGRITTYSVMISNPENLDEIVTQIKSELSDDYDVMDWRELNKEMVQAIQTDDVGGQIMLTILYMVIGFGMFGTIMMMTMERRKEFAIMVAIGMQKFKLFLVVLYETIMIGVVALIISIIITYPVLLYYFYNPIPLEGELAQAMEMFGAEPVLPFSLDADIFINQTLAVIVIAFIASLYPLTKILRFNVLQAMRS
ncbi:MAG: FtsX-like permease family protein [Melioribacteraceae bacterium]|nr:FtsX-like permease family protein [Melioribacteraceae bacterium]